MAELRRELTVPADMAIAPALGPIHPRTVQRYAALLVNPFYAKDPRASFGKHVLTPTLALLIEHSRRRHLKLRPRLDALGLADEAAARASQCVSAGV